MRTKVKGASPQVALTRILEGLGQELIDAPDEEIIAAAKDLGMDPKMRGSAAFAGLKYPARPQLSDFFELEVCRKIQAAPERIGADAPTNAKQKPKRPKLDFVEDSPRVGRSPRRR
jgi:hypothetical protein